MKVVAITFLSAALSALAQAPPPLPRFEVASIRPVPPGPPNADNPSFAAYRAGQAKSFCIVCISGVHYDNYGYALKALVSEAYRMDARLLVAPDWVNQAEVRFAIHAIMPEGTQREQIPDMLKALLEERFHLVVHRATVEQTGYALVAAKGGPKLKQPGDLDRSACEDWAEPNIVSSLANEVCRTSKQVGDRTVNITMMTHSAWGPLVTEMSRGEAPATHNEYYRIAMPKLAEMLTTTLSTGAGGNMPGAGSLVPIVDRTGIEGEWHVWLDRSYEADMALPTVSASLEKQGLRLERTTSPVEKLFVDKMDKMPTEN
jgi:uncharacterized protein (TIGR03435 family)